MDGALDLDLARGIERDLPAVARLHRTGVQGHRLSKNIVGDGVVVDEANCVASGDLDLSGSEQLSSLGNLVGLPSTDHKRNERAGNRRDRQKHSDVHALFLIPTAGEGFQ